MPSVYIHADVPALFRPKAVFALKTMLSAFFLRGHITEVSAAELDGAGPGIRLYYGSEPLKNSPDFDLCIRHDDSACKYYELGGKYDFGNVFYEQEYGFPVLFGQQRPPDRKAGIIYSDLVASAFYFLSDWEFVNEHTVPDQHGRLRYEESLASRLGIGDTPVVNQYAEHMMDLLRGVKPEVTHSPAMRGSWFGACITHDLDRIKKRYKGTVKREFFDIPVLNAHNLSLKQRYHRLVGSARDLLRPEDTYQASIRAMFRKEAELGIPPTVYFKSIITKHRNDAADYLHEPFMNEILSELSGMGGSCGLHASYTAGYNEPLFTAEKLKLERRLGRDVLHHRFHYLRYHPRRLAAVLRKSDIKTDSSVGWASRAGFRSAFTWPYYLFDLERNMESAVLEVPLMMMEVQFYNYMNMNPEQALQHCRKQADTVRKYGGVLCWNFHQHALDEAETPGGSFLFKESLDYLSSLKPVFLTLSDAHENL